LWMQSHRAPLAGGMLSLPFSDICVASVNHGGSHKLSERLALVSC
jgi:hypothetical protein